MIYDGISFNYNLFTISGDGFSSTKGAGYVEFDVRGTYYPVAEYTSWGNTIITGAVPQITYVGKTVEAVRVFNNYGLSAEGDIGVCCFLEPKAKRQPVLANEYITSGETSATTDVVTVYTSALDNTYITSAISSATPPPQGVSAFSIPELWSHYDLLGYMSSACGVPTSAIPSTYLDTGVVNSDGVVYTWWLTKHQLIVTAGIVEYSHDTHEIEELNTTGEFEEWFDFG